MIEHDDSQNVGTSNLRKEDPGYLAIKRYDDVGFTLTDDAHYVGSIVLYKNDVYDTLAPTNFTQLTDKHFRSWCSLKPEMILIGTGDKHHFLSPEHMAYFYTQGIGIETMRTDSACRTYSVIAGEMRNALVVLFPAKG